MHCGEGDRRLGESALPFRLVGSYLTLPYSKAQLAFYFYQRRDGIIRDDYCPVGTTQLGLRGAIRDTISCRQTDNEGRLCAQEGT